MVAQRSNTESQACNPGSNPAWGMFIWYRWTSYKYALDVLQPSWVPLTVPQQDKARPWLQAHHNGRVSHPSPTSEQGRW